MGRGHGRQDASADPPCRGELPGFSMVTDIWVSFSARRGDNREILPPGEANPPITSRRKSTPWRFSLGGTTGLQCRAMP
jgi:hypothetical protein